MLLTDYCVPDGISDCKAGFDQAVKDLAQTPFRTLTVPAGTYRFLSPPASITCALNLVGEGKAVSWFMPDYVGQYFLQIRGGIDHYGGGSIRDCSFAPLQNVAIAVWVLPHPETDPTVQSKNPHGLLIDNIQIGRYAPTGGTWGYGIYLDGSQNPSVNGTAPGIRVVAVRNTSISSHTVAPMWLYMAYGTRMMNVDAYVGPTTIGQNLSSNTLLYSGTCSLG